MRLKKIFLLGLSLMFVTTLFGQTYEEYLAKAKQYEAEKRWCYALGAYYDAMSTNISLELKQEAYDGYVTLRNAILHGQPGLGKFNVFTLHDEWKRKFNMTAVYISAIAAIAFGLWWSITHISFPVREDTPSIEMPSENVFINDAEQNTGVNPSISEKHIEYSGHDSKIGEPDVNMVQESDTTPVLKEKAAESIDAAALEDLFNEAFDQLQ